MRYDRPRFRLSGDCCLLVEFGEGIDPEVNSTVMNFFALLRENPPAGVKAIVPAYRSLALIYDPELTAPGTLQRAIADLGRPECRSDASKPKIVEIPVCYEGEFGPDMEIVSKHANLSAERIIALHCALDYPIYMIGFTPGFCYLGGMDPSLRTPRRKTPRTSVPEGSVGIAESQTGMYPVESPGGWQIIGRTPLRLFAPERENPFIYKAGDMIRFIPIGRDEFSRIAQRESYLGGH